MPAEIIDFCSDVILIDGISFNRVPAPWIVSVPCFQTQVVDLGMMMTMEQMYPIVTRCPLTMRTLCIEIYSRLLYNIPQASQITWATSDKINGNVILVRCILYEISYTHRLLDSLVVEGWYRVQEVPGSIPSQGPGHTKDVIKLIPVVPLFSTEHSKGKYWLFLY